MHPDRLCRPDRSAGSALVLAAASAFAFASAGCAKGGGPGILNDIGNAIDNAATSVVKAGRDVVGPRKAPPLIEPPEVESEDEAFKTAQAAYQEGKVAYQLAEYIEAVDHFKESFAAADGIEDQDIKAQIQSTLFFNLGQAERHAYDLDDDPARLARARDLLRNHLASDPNLTDEERAATEDTIAAIQEQIDTHGQAPAEGAPEAATEGDSDASDP